jgi:hypothetical protein
MHPLTVVGSLVRYGVTAGQRSSDGRRCDTALVDIGPVLADR